MAKKVIEETKEKKSKLQDAMDRMNKTYGVGTVLTLEGNSSETYNIIPTGSIGFDYIALGIGGFAKGKLYEIMGWEGTCKTTICGHAAAECQKQGGNVLYIDGEHAVDKLYFQSLGVDTAKLLITQPSSGEEGFNVAIEMIKTGEIDLVIIDSDSSLIPKAVIDGDVGESSIGKKARLNNNAYPKLKSLLVQYNTCMIVISQYREKIGVMFGNPTCTQGGHALKFYTDCRIEITKTIVKDDDVAYGNIVKVKATKNKMCPPYRIAKFEVVWGKGIDIIGELVELSVEHGIVTKAGSWYSYGEIKLGQGVDGITKLFNNNPELCEVIKQQLIDILQHPDELPIDTISEEVQIMFMNNA